MTTNVKNGLYMSRIPKGMAYILCVCLEW